MPLGRRLPNPYRTPDEYKRLTEIILPMQSVDVLLAAFPDFAEGWTDDLAQKRRNAESTLRIC